MEQLVTSEFKLGIIAGGQLGKLLTLAASNWDVRSYVLDPVTEAPASTTCTHFVKGDYNDFDTVYHFGKMTNMVTLEIEHVNTAALKKLQESGIRVIPDPVSIEKIQDKGIQKTALLNTGLESSEFFLAESKENILAWVKEGKIKIPFVQKLRKSGFDGRGVKIVTKQEDLDHLLIGPSVIEKLENVKKEISILVAHSITGEISTFPAVEMIFKPEANLVEYLVSPARIDDSLAADARELAIEAVKAFNIHGIAAVEMFITADDKLLINEIAPRPHNSGHHTIEGNFTSQYEQHLRAIFGFPLGSMDIKIPSIMVNLLGEEGYSGKVKYEGLTDCLRVEGIKLHIYGKKETRPFRKMGHATVLDKNLDRAWEKAKYIKDHLKVKSW